MTIKRMVLFTLVALVAAGCQAKPEPRADYQTIAQDPQRDSQAAREHNARGVMLMKAGDLDAAGEAFKAALAADPFCGPAHNNLGTVYHRQGDYYQAAWEFQYAAKVMPHRSEPRNNLGLVLEDVGKMNEAAQWYEEALQLEPGSPDYIGNLARLYVRENRKDGRTRELLQEIVMRDQRPEWVDWAKEKLAVMGNEVRPPVAPDQPMAEQP